MTKSAANEVWVRRQYNDHNVAAYRFEDISDLRWSDLSGGMRARANRRYLCGYVRCDRAVAGAVSHSGAHSDCPHLIKICIVQKDNPKELYALLLKRKEWQDSLKKCPFAVDLGDSAVDAAELDSWLTEHSDAGSYHKVDLGWWDPSFQGKGPRGPQVWFADSGTAQKFANRFTARLMHAQNAAKRDRAALTMTLRVL